jgi:hypothetical protein
MDESTNRLFFRVADNHFCFKIRWVYFTPYRVGPIKVSSTDRRSLNVQIVYCDKCGLRVPVEDAAASVAPSGDSQKVYCPKCASVNEPKRAASTPGTKSHPATMGRSPSKALDKHAGRSHKQGSRATVIGGAVTVAALGLISVLLFGSKTTPTAATSSPSSISSSSSTASGNSAKAALPAIAKETPLPTPKRREPTHEQAAELAPKPQPKVIVQQPVQTPNVLTPPPNSDFEDNIKEIAAKYLAEAKSLQATDPAAYKDKLTRIVTTYRSTPSSTEAARLLEAANVEERATPAKSKVAVAAPALPAPPDVTKGNSNNPPEANDFTPLFDGKTLGCLDNECIAAWKIEKGAIVNGNTDYGGGQGRTDFKDGKIHFKFENTAADEITFLVRQGEAGKYKVTISKAECASLAGKAHDLEFVCDGATVTATLDGKAATVTSAGQPREGRFKFSVDHGTLRVLEIESQKLPAK